MDLAKRRWVVLAASCLVNLCIGSLYAWSVFANPMAAHLSELTGSNVESLAIVFTVANGVGPITMISGGFFNDRIGPKWVVFIGGLLFGAGMIGSGFATSVPMLLATYGLGVGLGMGMVYGATVSNSVKFFPDKRGLAGGIATASYGISSVIVPLIANALINSFDVATAFKVLGIAMLVVICTMSFLVVKCPQGYAPDGWQPPEVSNASHAPVDKDWRGMLSDPVFYVMMAMMLCGAFAGLMITSQASPIAQNMVGMSSAEAAIIVSILALFNTSGRIVSGFLSDKLGAVGTLRLVFVALVVGMALLFVSSGMNRVAFIAGICVVGFCFGSVMGIYPGFTADQFGAANNSVNYGIMFIGFALAGFAGPMAMNTLLNVTGNYQPAFVVAIGLGMIGFVLTVVYRKRTSVGRNRLP